MCTCWLPDYISSCHSGVLILVTEEKGTQNMFLCSQSITTSTKAVVVGGESPAKGCVPKRPCTFLSVSWLWKFSMFLMLWVSWTLKEKKYMSLWMELKSFPWKSLSVVILFVKVSLHHLISLESSKLQFGPKRIYGSNWPRQETLYFPTEGTVQVLEAPPFQTELGDTK